MRQYFIALSAVAIVAATPVAARDFKVVYSDLDLQTASGQKQLSHRIDKSAREYCDLSTETGSRIPRQGARECYVSARAAAREQMKALVEKSQLGG